MPSGPPELQAKWGDDAAALKFLADRGYKLLRTWDHKKPTPDHVPDADENSALDYLFLEWDYGDAV